MTATVTVPNNAKWIVAQIVYSGDDNKDAIVASCHVELGSVPSSYEPYQRQQVTIDLDGTRYGGMLDVITGQMTVDREYETIFSWTSATTSIEGKPRFRSDLQKNALPSDTNQNLNYSATNCLPLIFAGATSSNFTGFTINQNRIYVYVEGITTVEGMNQFVNDNNLQLVYTLATPVTVQLSPSQLTTLLGQNNIWADTGDTSVTYRADTKLYIDSRLSQMLALILEN